MMSISGGTVVVGNKTRKGEEMKTVMVDGREVVVEDVMNGDQIHTLVQCPPQHFPVIMRSPAGSNCSETMPVPRGKNPNQLQNGDRLTSLFQVDNG